MPEVLDEKRGVQVTRVVDETPDPLWTKPLSWVRGRRSRMAAAVVVVLSLAVGGFLLWSSRDLPGDVAVRVGDEDVTVSELRSRMSTVEALYGVKVPADAKKREEFWRDAAQSVAVGLVLEDAVEEEGLAITENDVDQAVQQVVTSFFGQGEEGRSAFAEALGNAGASEESVREELRRQLEINALFATVTEEVASPNADDVEAAYADRRCTLAIPEKRRLRNVVVATRADAEEALRRLRGGTPFTAVVAALSIDGSTQDSGGDLGVVGAADLEKEYAEAAFSAGKGELFGPVKSEFGWNVGRVDAVARGRVPSLEESRDQLRQTLFSEGQSKAWRSWLRSQLEQAAVEYGDEHRPKDPLELPAGTAATSPGGPVSDDAPANAVAEEC